jgi:hypothetical protein
MKNELDPALLRKLLRYEPETGKLFWLPRSAEIMPPGLHAAAWNGKYAGKEAFTATGSHGYRASRVCNVQCLAHRLIWAFVHGSWPEGQIDHINGDRQDNRIANLRVVDAATNARNKCISSRSTSKIAGVYWAAHAGKWRAEIKVGQKRQHLGYFTDKSAAAFARKTAEMWLDFHPNHGRAA